MESLKLWQRSSDYGPGPGPYPDVSKIPTPPLQMAGVAIMFVLPAIAIVVFSLRVYTRLTMRTFGVGMWPTTRNEIRIAFTNLGVPDDWLCGLALVKSISSAHSPIRGPPNVAI